MEENELVPVHSNVQQNEIYLSPYDQGPLTHHEEEAFKALADADPEVVTTEVYSQDGVTGKVGYDQAGNMVYASGTPDHSYRDELGRPANANSPAKDYKKVNAA